MNKYYRLLGKIMKKGKAQTNKKGNIRYLLNEQLSLTPADAGYIRESRHCQKEVEERVAVVYAG